MTGGEAVTLLRKALRDSETIYRQGAFFSDKEIYLALNNAQMHLVHLSLQSKKHYWMLRRLVSIFPAVAFDTIPNDYLHAIAASADGNVAQLYFGAEATAYLSTVQRGAFILGEYVYFRNNGQAAITGTLTYYKHPSPITEFVEMQDFDDTVYDAILDYAAILLGMKESQKPREKKLYSRAQASLAAMAQNGFVHTAQGAFQ